MRTAIVILTLAMFLVFGFKTEQATAQSTIKGEEGTTIVLGQYGKDDDDNDGRNGLEADGRIDDNDNDDDKDEDDDNEEEDDDDDEVDEADEDEAEETDEDEDESDDENSDS